MYVYIWWIHLIVQQKLTQHCKAIILQTTTKKGRDVCECEKSFREDLSMSINLFFIVLFLFSNII